MDNIQSESSLTFLSRAVLTVEAECEKHYVQYSIFVIGIRRVHGNQVPVIKCAGSCLNPTERVWKTKGTRRPKHAGKGSYSNRGITK